jgi:Flp pilus assembly pilin Flp
MTEFSNMIGLRLAMMLQGVSMPNLKREEGQTLAEYALILAFIAAVVVGVVIILGNKISSLFTSISNDL